MGKLDDYQILEELGKGTYGKVFKVRRKKPLGSQERQEHSETIDDDLFINNIGNRRKKDPHICVVKQVSIEGLSDKDKEETLNEVRVMNQCEHFNIIKYNESFIEDGYLNIVMDYAPGGDLAKRIKSNCSTSSSFKEELLWNYLIQISQGLKYLHDKRILHRDIKPQNIFLDEDDNVKIGDMGLGRILGPQSSFANTGVGTPLYFSPELCEGQPYNYKSDIWAFGCLMYELATLRPPFIASNQIALAKKIVSENPPQLPKHYSMELQFLINKMLEKDVNKRPDINHVLNYAPVKLKIQKARLRHKEVKLHEKYLSLEKELRLQYKRKLGDLEDRERQLAREKDFMNKWQEKLEMKERELTRLQRNLINQQQGNLTPNRTSSPIPSSQKNNATKEALEEKFDDFCSIIDNHLSSPYKSPRVIHPLPAIRQNKRPKSAPSTPLRNRSQKNETPIKRSYLTPSPQRPSSAHQINSIASSNSSIYGSPIAYGVRTISAVYLGICSEEDSRAVAPFELLFHWTRGQYKLSWNNDKKHDISKPSPSLIITYKVSYQSAKHGKFNISKLFVLYKGETKLSLLHDKDSAQPSSMTKSSESHKNGDYGIRYMIDIPASKTRNKPITHVKIKFENAHSVEEVIVTKYESRLLELSRNQNGNMQELNKQASKNTKQNQYKFSPSQKENHIVMPVIANSPKASPNTKLNFNDKQSPDWTKQLNPQLVQKLFQKINKKHKLVN